VHLAEAAGLAICARGLRRYFGLRLARGGTVELVEDFDGEALLASAPFDWQFETDYTLSLAATAGRLGAWINGEPLFTVPATPERLAGAVALLCREGCASFGPVRVEPSGPG
jgi:hypothetical protein